MTAGGNITKNHRPVNRLAEWSVTIAALAFVLGVVFATARIAPAQERAGAAPTLQAPEVDAGKTTPSLPATGESLSERLDRSDGVIRPPGGIDPQISVAPKDPGAGSNMPVIRPPAQPGSQPK